MSELSQENVSAPREPRQLTTSDLIVSTFWIAVVFATFPIGGGGAALLLFLPATAPIYVSGVLLFRSMRFSRWPDPEEWVPVALAAILVSWTLPDIDNTLEYWHRLIANQTVEHFTFWRWFATGAAGATAVLLLLIALGGRHYLPKWIGTILVFLVAVAMHWGPIYMAHHYWSPPLIVALEPFAVAAQIHLEVNDILKRLPLDLMILAPCFVGIVAARRGESPSRCWISLASRIMAWVVTIAYVCVGATWLLLSETGWSSLSKTCAAAVWFCVIGTTFGLIRRYYRRQRELSRASS